MTEYIKSASIILQKTTGEVLLCHRNPDLRSFGNLWVFPGGKIEDNLPDDWIGDEFESKETILREMYEEIGVLPGVSSTFGQSDRSRNIFTLDYNEEDREIFEENMRFVGRKRTPNFSSRGFDAAYFIIQHELVDSIKPMIDGSELIDQQWLHPKEAIVLWELGELLMPPPIVHLLRTLSEDPENFDLRTMVETDLPIGLQTKIEFAPGILAIPMVSNTIPPFISTNMGILQSENEIAIVDPGTTDESHLEEVLAMFDNITYVILTHHHNDHTDGLKFLERISPDSTVIAHDETLTHISTTLKTMKIERSFLVGNIEFEVIKTPGHTSGHICIFDLKSKILFSGDHVVGYGSAVLDPETGDMSDYFESTNKLLKLSSRIIIPAHGPPVYNPESKLLEYLDHRKAREESIYNCILEGANDLDTIVAKVYEDIPKKMWEYAKQNIILHIRKLVKEDRISSDFSQY